MLLICLMASIPVSEAKISIRKAAKTTYGDNLNGPLLIPHDGFYTPTSIIVHGRNVELAKNNRRLSFATIIGPVFPKTKEYTERIGLFGIKGVSGPVRLNEQHTIITDNLGAFTYHFKSDENLDKGEHFPKDSNIIKNPNSESSDVVSDVVSDATENPKPNENPNENVDTQSDPPRPFEIPKKFTIYEFKKTKLVISDVDDTLKESHTSNGLTAVKYIFTQPTVAFETMKQKLAGMKNDNDFVYLSASFSQTYPFIKKFLVENYPQGPLFLRTFSIFQKKAIADYKFNNIIKIIDLTPKHDEVTLIGDSTQVDAEAYGRVYAAMKNKVGNKKTIKIIMHVVKEKQKKKVEKKLRKLMGDEAFESNVEFIDKTTSGEQKTNFWRKLISRIYSSIGLMI
eukprot:NODE_224_length_12322_cov_0.795549.p1 type:complete len:397 gc:universal NODE_224_length_12322_cov_0.795549:10900-12090(+)